MFPYSNGNKRMNNWQLEKIKWHGTRIEFVEFVYALHETGSFGKTTLKKAFFLLGNFFDFEVQDYYRQFWDVRNRVTEDRAFFLNKLKTKLSEKLARMDT